MRTGLNANGIEMPVCCISPLAVIVRAGPWLTTVADTDTIAAPSSRSLVWIAGSTTSVAPSGRIVTSRFSPPKLNQPRCQPSRFICSGSRQSARTTSVCLTRPLRRARASNGR